MSITLRKVIKILNRFLQRIQSLHGFHDVVTTSTFLFHGHEEDVGECNKEKKDLRMSPH